MMVQLLPQLIGQAFYLHKIQFGRNAQSFVATYFFDLIVLTLNVTCVLGFYFKLL